MIHKLKLSQQHFLAVAAVLFLSACAPENADINEWMRQQKEEIQRNTVIQPLVAPSVFTPQAYTGTQSIDPFDVAKLESDSVKNNNSSPLFVEQANRRKEPLEAFPLDNIIMVGSVNRGGKRIALVNVAGAIYYVRVGEYVGQNYGKIMAINEADIQVKEIVQDAAGEWIERPTTIQLQEASSN